jgi:hypothetical protein
MISLPRCCRARRPRRTALLSCLEVLEGRLMPSVAAGAGVPVPPAVVSPVIQPEPVPPGPTTDGTTVQPQTWSQSTPWGFTPQQIAEAYGFNGISFGTTARDGAGQTIAIVDAYDDPALVDGSNPDFAASDLAKFDQQYGLPDPPSFVKLNEWGSTTGLPGVDPAGPGTAGDWEEEEALDVEWAHAMAPAASIILVECQSTAGADLYAGAKMAAALPGVSVVSMSWGASEYSGENAFDSDFTTPAGHQGVTFVASTGDMGAPGLYPAYSPNVLAVGGTTLTLLNNGGYGSESGWSDGGGGTSVYEPEPAYQAGVQATGMRTIPDVAFDANPNTGVSIYDSYDDTSGDGAWMSTGGTSLAAPVWAALIAIADQGRVAAGGTTLDGPSQVLPALYALPAADFHDVTTGGNGVFEAGPGYDESTGLGSPVAPLVAEALAYYDLAPWLAVASEPPTAVAAGQSFDMTVAVENSDGSLDTNFVGSVAIGLGANPGGASLDGTLTATVVDGYATFAGLSLTRADDGYTILAATADGPAAATTAPFTVAPGTPAQLVVLSVPASDGPGGLTVTVMDAYGNLVTSYDGGVTLLWGSQPSGHPRHTRHADMVATATGGIATFAHVKPGTASRRHVIQAETDGLIAAAVIALPDRTAVLRSTTDHHPASPVRKPADQVRKATTDGTEVAVHRPKVRNV